MNMTKIIINIKHYKVTYWE